MADEILSQGFDIADTGAVVCSHVANDGAAILYIQRDEPEDPTDSGFWFRCSGDSHDPADEVIMTIRDVVAMDPTVLPLLEREPGVAWSRETPESPWAAEAYGWSGG